MLMLHLNTITSSKSSVATTESRNKHRNKSLSGFTSQLVAAPAVPRGLDCEVGEKHHRCDPESWTGLSGCMTCQYPGWFCVPSSVCHNLPSTLYDCATSCERCALEQTTLEIGIKYRNGQTNAYLNPNTFRQHPRSQNR